MILMIKINNISILGKLEKVVFSLINIKLSVRKVFCLFSMKIGLKKDGLSRKKPTIWHMIFLLAALLISFYLSASINMILCTLVLTKLLPPLFPISEDFSVSPLSYSLFSAFIVYIAMKFTLGTRFLPIIVELLLDQNILTSSHSLAISSIGLSPGISAANGSGARWKNIENVRMKVGNSLIWISSSTR